MNVLIGHFSTLDAARSKAHKMLSSYPVLMKKASLSIGELTDSIFRLELHTEDKRILLLSSLWR